MFNSIEIQIQTTVRYHSVLIRMAIIKNTTKQKKIANISEDMEKWGP